jgi:hypothetical protein
VTDDIHSPTNAGPAEIGQSPLPGDAGATPAEATDLGEEPARPELMVAGAFAGGLVVAMILRRLGG